MDPLNQLHQLWDSFAFTRLLRTFRMSVAPAKILIAMMAIILICGFGWLMDTITTTIDGRPLQKTMKPGVESIAQLDTPPHGPMYKDKEKKILVLEEFSKYRGVF
jgi:hypothetical protein